MLAAVGALLVGVDGLEPVVDAALDAVVDVLHHPHALLLLRDPASERLVTYASRGYDTIGVGSEVLLGHGVIGTAALGRRPMRIGNLQRMLAYLRTAQQRPAPWIPGAEEALPGLPAARSQLAAPMVVGGALVGVLAVESEQAMRYDETDELVLALTAQLVGALIAEELSDPAGREQAEEQRPAVEVGPGARHATIAPSACATTSSTAARSWTTSTSSRASPVGCCGSWRPSTQRPAGPRTRTVRSASTRRWRCPASRTTSRAGSSC